MLTLLLSITLVLLIAASVILFALKKIPGVGILIAAVVILATIVLRKTGLASLGFLRPDSWPRILLLALALGFGLNLLSILVIEPPLEKAFHKPLDYSAFEKLRKDWRQLVVMLLVSWLLAAFLEESIFRGFLLQEIANWFGSSALGVTMGLVLSSTIFGLAHWYQGKSGVLCTAIIGALLAAIFVWGGYNLWLPILTHGFIDTFGLVMMYFKLDLVLKEKLWKMQQRKTTSDR
jgi:membrane protease YdiL (CAAX protease family)